MKNKFNINCMKGGAVDNMVKIPEYEEKPVSEKQLNLLKKLLKASKFTNGEYEEIKEICSNRVVNSYDASVVIDYLLSTLKFRRRFFSKRRKAYKKCDYCGSRDDVERYMDLINDKRFWLCKYCYDAGEFPSVIPVAEAENIEVKADLHRKYDNISEDQLQQLAEIECSGR